MIRTRKFVPAVTSEPGDEPRRIWRGATIDGDYRYWLFRDWSELEQTRARPLFIMLNPSTADSQIDDPTCRKCMGFADAWGFSGVEIANLFAFRATKPEDLWRVEPEDREGPGNDDALDRALRCVAMGRDQGLEVPVVFAWGVLPPVARHRPLAVLKMAERHGIRPACLGKSDKGHPKHPLYLPYSTPLTYYR
jgi:hypothetical protein